MSYFVIDKECSNKIYDNDDFEISLKKFKSEEEANNYLNGVTKSKVCSIKVFTDGACSNNGNSNAKAGMGVYFSENDMRNVSKRIKGKQTNNTAELSAIIEVFTILDNEINEGYDIIIYTDSEYSIKCCGPYGEKCSKKGWKNKKGFICNHELVKKGYELFKQHCNVSLKYIKAHTGLSDELSKGNEGADRLAVLSIIDSIQLNTTENSFIYLNCPFEKKDIARELGAKWDKSKKKWYYEKGSLSILKISKLNELFGQ
jgi:ribonuclease HI